jgi:hypothetical protein
MTKQEQTLIDAIHEFELNQENVSLELIEAYSKFKIKLNKIGPDSNFTKTNSPIDIKDCQKDVMYWLNDYYLFR